METVTLPAAARPPLPPALVLAFGLMGISTGSVLIRLAQQEAPSAVVAAARLGLATLVLLPFSIRTALVEWRKLSRRSVAWLLLAGVFLALHFATWIASLELTSVASSVVLVTTTPLWVAMASPLFLRERIRPLVWAGLITAMLGGAIVGLGGQCLMVNGSLDCGPSGAGGQGILGNLLALIGAWTAAGYMLVGRKVRGEMSLGTYTLTVYGLAALLLFGQVIIQGLTVTNFPPVTYLWFGLLALLPQVLGHTSLNWALRYLPAALVTTVILGEPIGTTMLAILFLGEHPTPAELLGGMVILIGIYIAARNQEG